LGHDNSSSKDNKTSSFSGPKSDRRVKKEKARKNRDYSNGSSGPSRTRPNPNSNANITYYTCNKKGHYSSSWKYSKYSE